MRYPVKYTDPHPNLLYVVLVGHGQSDTTLASVRLSAIVREYGATLIAVDTSVQLALEDDTGVNDAFEFSGYEYGLKKACSVIRRNHIDHRDDELFRVVILNSTAFTAHISMLARAFFRFVFSAPGLVVEKPTVVGLRWEARSPISDVAHLGWYFATNLFCMIGPVSKLDSFSFYDRRQVAKFRDAEFSSLPDAYSRTVIDWLSSTSLLGGWYKANPFAAISPSELVRKRITIYLEHSLPGRFTTAGFASISANRDNGSTFRWLFKFLIVIDRCYVNMLKLGYRGRLVLARIFWK